MPMEISRENLTPEGKGVKISKEITSCLLQIETNNSWSSIKIFDSGKAVVAYQTTDGYFGVLFQSASFHELPL